MSTARWQDRATTITRTSVEAPGGKARGAGTAYEVGIKSHVSASPGEITVTSAKGRARTWRVGDGREEVDLVVWAYTVGNGGTLTGWINLLNGGGEWLVAISCNVDSAVVDDLAARSGAARAHVMDEDFTAMFKRHKAPHMAHVGRASTDLAVLTVIVGGIVALLAVIAVVALIIG